MKLSLSLLRKFVPIPPDLSPERLSDIITTSIAEVEGYEEVARDGIVVAKVISVSPHPKADRLQVAQVTNGQQEFQVVCGGTNLREGQLVAFAQVGSKVKWHGEGEEITMEKATLRGVESEGMICASEEIGLHFEEGEREILDLSSKLGEESIGKNLYEALQCPGEVVLEIDNKSLTHRPDLFGHYGFARDISVVFNNRPEYVKGELRPYLLEKPALGNTKLDIRVESKICQAFSSVLLEDITIQPSPVWLQQALLSTGIRPINNVVDVTNYVMIELGQPMHAYDYTQISGGTLTIRSAREQEKVFALNGKEYELSAADSVISDQEKALLIVGIMGCENSGVSESTTSILLEAGSWDPVMVRTMAQRLGLRSDASTRFEKDLDPRYTTPAILRAIQLLRELIPEATVSSELFEYSDHSKQPRTINLDLAYASRLLGIQIDPDRAKMILQDLGCQVDVTKNKEKNLKDPEATDYPLPTTDFSVTPPTWRSTKDLLIAEDLIEELGRIMGYGEIPYTPLVGPLIPHIDLRRMFERKLRRRMAYGLGYHEVENYSLGNNERDVAIAATTSGIEVANPLTQDIKHFKASLLPDLLRNAALDTRLREEFKLFELSRLYRQGEDGISEHRCLAGILGRDKRLSTTTSSYDDLLFRAKEDVDTLLDSIEIGPREYVPATTLTHLGQGMDIVIGGQPIGHITKVDSTHTDSLDLFDIVVFELDLDGIEHNRSSMPTIRPLPRFPESVRDIAVLVDQSITSSQLEHTLSSASPLVQSVSLFDVFEGGDLPTDTRSLAYHLTIGSDDHTLTEQEITTALTTARKAVEKLGAKVRE